MTTAASVDGTFATCRQTLRMSVHRGRPEVVGHGQNSPNDRTETLAVHCGRSLLPVSRLSKYSFEPLRYRLLSMGRRCDGASL